MDKELRLKLYEYYKLAKQSDAGVLETWAEGQET